MKKVSISKIKAELSKYLRMVALGETVVILDRDHPVAMLTAIPSESTVQILEAERNSKIFFESLKVQDDATGTEILAVLDIERSDRI